MGIWKSFSKATVTSLDNLNKIVEDTSTSVTATVNAISFQAKRAQLTSFDSYLETKEAIEFKHMNSAMYKQDRERELMLDFLAHEKELETKANKLGLTLEDVDARLEQLKTPAQSN